MINPTIPTSEESVLPNYISWNSKCEDGTLTGGSVCGCGFTIVWQNGALRIPNSSDLGDEIVGQNGAFVEDILAACRDRLSYYQDSRLSCFYNQRAIDHLNQAINELNSRTSDRSRRGVEAHGSPNAFGLSAVACSQGTHQI